LGFIVVLSNLKYCTLKTVNKRTMDVRTKVIALSAQFKSQQTTAEQV